MEKEVKSKRRFASMDPEKQRAIARKGGQCVPAELRSFSQNSELVPRHSDYDSLAKSG